MLPFLLICNYFIINLKLLSFEIIRTCHMMRYWQIFPIIKLWSLLTLSILCVEGAIKYTNKFVMRWKIMRCRLYIFYWILIFLTHQAHWKINEWLWIKLMQMRYLLKTCDSNKNATFLLSHFLIVLTILLSG